MARRSPTPTTETVDHTDWKLPGWRYCSTCHTPVGCCANSRFLPNRVYGGMSERGEYRCKRHLMQKGGVPTKKTTPPPATKEQLELAAHRLLRHYVTERDDTVAGRWMNGWVRITDYQRHVQGLAPLTPAQRRALESTPRGGK